MKKFNQYLNDLHTDTTDMCYAGNMKARKKLRTKAIQQIAKLLEKSPATIYRFANGEEMPRRLDRQEICMYAQQSLIFVDKETGKEIETIYVNMTSGYQVADIEYTAYGFEITGLRMEEDTIFSHLSFDGVEQTDIINLTVKRGIDLFFPKGTKIEFSIKSGSVTPHPF